jgi:hypothetical protein
MANKSSALADVYHNRDCLRLVALGLTLDDSTSPHACRLQPYLMSFDWSVAFGNTPIAFCLGTKSIRTSLAQHELQKSH